MDVQFVDEKKGNGSIFEVIFSNYSDDKKIEKIIAGGLNTFQKRNPYIKVEDGFIEFFEDNSIKLRIESTCQYPLSKRRIEDLKQELIVAFKMTSEEKAYLESKRQVESKEKPILTAIQEMKEEWNARLVNEVGALRKAFADELSSVQPIIKQELGQQLQGIEEQRSLRHQELQETIILGNDLMTDHLQEILQREKNSSAKLKKRMAALDSSIEQKLEQKIEQNYSVLEGLLVESNKETANGHLEKIEFLKEKLSSEIDENNFDLKEELNVLSTTLSKKIEEDTQKSVKEIQQLNEVVGSADDLSVEREHHLNQRLDGFTQSFTLMTEKLESIPAIVETKDEQLVKRLDGLEEAVRAVTAVADKKPDKSEEEQGKLILAKISELKDGLNKKIEEELNQINETVQLNRSKASEEDTATDAVLEEQLTAMKALIEKNMSQITPLFSTLQKENIMLTRKIDRLESLVTSVQIASIEQQAAAPEPKEKEAGVDTEKVEKKEAVKKVETTTVTTDEEPANVSEEQPKEPLEELPENKKEAPEEAEVPEIKLEPLKPSQPERKIKKIELNVEKEAKPKEELSNQNQSVVQRILSTMPQAEPEPKPPRERPAINPFHSDYVTLKERFSELENSPRFDKPVRLSKFDYRKSITHVHYIEYRWENAILDKEDYHFFGLDTFEEEINVLPEFLAALKEDGRKESLFNQNSFKLKKTVWEKIKAYHLLSIYLDQILTWKQG